MSTTIPTTDVRSHESVHACVALWGGLAVQEIIARRDGTGHCRIKYDAAKANDLAFYATAVVAPAAHLRLHGHYVLGGDGFGCEEDAKLAAKILADHGRLARRPFDPWRLACAALRTPEIQRQIEALARSLRLDVPMKGSDVLRVLAGCT